MKDAKLLDNTLITLLRLPEAERTPEVIHSHLTLAAIAAGMTLEGATPLQLEHMKLSSAVALLAGELGEGFTHCATLRISPEIVGTELFASIEAIGKREIRFTGFGHSAERVLAMLRTAISQHGLALSTGKKRTARWGERDPLRHLGREAARA